METIQSAPFQKNINFILLKKTIKMVYIGCLSEKLMLVIRFNTEQFVSKMRKTVDRGAIGAVNWANVVCRAEHRQGIFDSLKNLYFLKLNIFIIKFL